MNDLLAAEARTRTRLWCEIAKSECWPDPRAVIIQTALSSMLFAAGCLAFGIRIGLGG